MKKRILAVLVAVIVAVSAAAQDKPATEAGHSISVDLFGVQYAYELPVARTATITGRVEAKFFAVFGASRQHSNYSGYVGVIPTVELEPRWYYGLDRRAANGRNTAGNQGSFVALRLYTYLPYGYCSASYVHMDGVAWVAPTWGLRRVWRDGWMFEFHTGPRLGYGYHGDFADRPFFKGIDLNVRFGYRF